MTTPFQIALEAYDLDALRACPKADLHVHSIGGGNWAFLRERTGRDISWMRCTWSKEHFADLFVGTSGRALALEATFVQARRDGVTRIETGEDVWSVTLHEGSAVAVWESLNVAHARGAPEVDWIPQMGISPHCSFCNLETWVAAMLDLGVFETVDLSGDEFAQPIEVFAPLYRRAKASGLGLKAHVGEWGTAALSG